jgi:hypothetical protein
VTLTEYADAIEKSGRKGDQLVARYIRSHRARIEGWLQDSMRTLGSKATKADREDLTQVALLAITQVVQQPDADTALNEVKNAMQNSSNRQKAWNGRKVDIIWEEK